MIWKPPITQLLLFQTVDQLDESIECGSVWNWLKMSNPNGEPTDDNFVEEIKEDTADAAVENGMNTPQITNGGTVTESQVDKVTIVENKISIQKKEVVLAKPGKLSSNFINAFENNTFNKSVENREIKPISLITETKEKETKSTVDEERKRRLLGLPPLEAQNGKEEKGQVEGNGAPDKVAMNEPDLIQTFAAVNLENSQKSINCST